MCEAPEVRSPQYAFLLEKYHHSAEAGRILIKAVHVRRVEVQLSTFISVLVERGLSPEKQ